MGTWGLVPIIVMKAETHMKALSVDVGASRQSGASRSCASKNKVFLEAKPYVSCILLSLSALLSEDVKIAFVRSVGQHDNF